MTAVTLALYGYDHQLPRPGVWLPTLVRSQSVLRVENTEAPIVPVSISGRRRTAAARHLRHGPRAVYKA